MSNGLNEPLLIDGKSSVSVELKSDDKELLVHQITPVPGDKFDVNLIKMSPYCIVNNKK